MSSIPRFFVPPDLIRGNQLRFPDYQATQISQVLRLRAGDAVLVLDDTGLIYDVVLSEVSRGRAAGTIRASREAGGEPVAQVTLYQSLLKRDKFELVLQKATEIGAARVTPVITRRTLVRDAEDVTPEKVTRWERIITEAAEQCGRGRLPELGEPLSFAEALAEAREADRIVIAYEGAAATNLHQALVGLPSGATLALFIGPEGGYDDDEIAQAAAHGAAVVTLGPRIMRTETAAMVALALALHELGEMG